MQKSTEGGLHSHCFSVLFFVFSCLLSISASFILKPPARGHDSFRPVDDAGSPAWLAITGIIVAVVAMLKSFLAPIFGVMTGASKSSKRPSPRWGFVKPRG